MVVDRNLGFVRSGFGKQTVNRGEDFLGLISNALALRLIGDLAGEIDRRAVNDGLRHARTGMQSFD